MSLPRFAAPALLLLASGLVWAQEQRYGIKDEASLFSKEAVKKAGEDIAKVHEQYKKDLFIETLKEGPKDNFLDWARERARQHKFSGVYVVITVNPHKLEVLVDKQTRDKGLFTTRNAEETAKIMLDELREKKLDDALVKGTQYVRETFRKNSTLDATRPKSGSGGSE